MTAVGVLGKGGATPHEVITEGLRDSIASGTDKILLPWFGKPIPADLEVVYDWVLDNEVLFAMYADDVSSAPKAFRTADFGKVIEGDPVDSIIAGCSTLLYLWDDDDEVFARMEDSKKRPHLVMDLTAGLIPVEVEDHEAPAPVADDDDDDLEIGDLSRSELEVMPALAVKRYATAKLGTSFSTKSAAIEALFPETEEEDPTDDAPAKPESSDSPVAKVTALMDAAINVIYNNEGSDLYRNQALFRLTEARMWAIAAFTEV